MRKEKGNLIIQLAEYELGQKESPANSNMTQYGRWYGLDGLAWCAMFVSWCYAQAGYTLNIQSTKGFAGCQYAVNKFKQLGEITTEPTAGDIVFYDFNGDGRFDHCGIFEEWLNAPRLHFTAIEGNTSKKGSQNNGGEVMRKVRVNKNVIFVHPKILN